MIKLVPIEAAQHLEALCGKYSVVFDDTIRAYISDKDSPEAVCIFSLENYRVRLLAISFAAGDPLLPELLVRAAASYAANRSGYLFEISKAVGKPIESTLKTLRFEESETKYCGKVPKILEGACRCKNKE